VTYRAIFNFAFGAKNGTDKKISSHFLGSPVLPKKLRNLIFSPCAVAGQNLEVNFHSHLTSKNNLF
jgi:hypothetical protein